MDEKAVIVVLGRGVGWSEKLAKWVPTGLFEKMDLRGDRPRHTGVITDADPEDPEVRYGGGEINAEAAGVLYLSKKDEILAIYLAAGYPPYLKEMDARITEGEVLEERIAEEIGKRGQIIDKARLVHTYPSNLHTLDDLQQSMKEAVRAGINKLIFVTVGLHIPRAQAMAEEITKLPEFRDLNIEFRGSEEILEQENPKWKAIFAAAKNTKAYQVTEVQEKRGLEAFLRGEYNKGV